MTAQQERKRAIRAFFVHYTDERLAALLAHARDGKLQYYSCCCFVGAATADHALVRDYKLDPSAPPPGWHVKHYQIAKHLEGAAQAEQAYAWLDDSGSVEAYRESADVVRQRILIPIIRTEMKRREYARKATQSLSRTAIGTGKADHQTVSATEEVS